jgi:hypothetical protein
MIINSILIVGLDPNTPPHFVYESKCFYADPTFKNCTR